MDQGLAKGAIGRVGFMDKSKLVVPKVYVFKEVLVDSAISIYAVIPHLVCAYRTQRR